MTPVWNLERLAVDLEAVLTVALLCTFHWTLGKVYWQIEWNIGPILHYSKYFNVYYVLVNEYQLHYFIYDEIHLKVCVVYLTYLIFRGKCKADSCWEFNPELLVWAANSLTTKLQPLGNHQSINCHGGRKPEHMVNDSCSSKHNGQTQPRHTCFTQNSRSHPLHHFYTLYMIRKQCRIHSLHQMTMRFTWCLTLKKLIQSRPSVWW